MTNVNWKIGTSFLDAYNQTRQFENIIKRLK